MERKPRVHGRDHRPGGADQFGCIVYDSENDGGYLSVAAHDRILFTNDGEDGLSLQDTGIGGLLFTAASAIIVTNSGDGGIQIENDGNGGIGIINTAGGGTYISDAGTMQIIASELDIEAPTSGVTISSSNTPSHFQPRMPTASTNVIELLAGDHTTRGAVIIGAFDNTGLSRLASTTVGVIAFLNPGESGLTFRGSTHVVDTGQAFVVTNWTGYPIFEARVDGSVHIKTGTSIVADL